MLYACWVGIDGLVAGGVALSKARLLTGQSRTALVVVAVVVAVEKTMARGARARVVVGTGRLMMTRQARPQRQRKLWRRQQQRRAEILLGGD